MNLSAASGTASTLGALGAGTGGRNININNGGTLSLTSNNVLGGPGLTAANLPTINIDSGGTLTSTRYNPVGNLTLNGGTLMQSSTDTGSFLGYVFLGSVTATNTSGTSTISSGNGKGNHLRGAATTTFSVASGGTLLISNPLINGSGDYAGAGSLNKTGPGTLALRVCRTYEVR